MKSLITPAKELLEGGGDWKYTQFLRKIKRGDRVITRGAELSGTVTDVLPDHYTIIVSLDNGPSNKSYHKSELTKIAQ